MHVFHKFPKFFFTLMQGILRPFALYNSSHSLSDGIAQDSFRIDAAPEGGMPLLGDWDGEVSVGDPALFATTVLREVLDLADSELRELRGEGVIGPTPLGS